MSKANYSLNSKYAPFSAMDDDDDMTSAFMNSSSANYLAADRLPYSAYDEREISEEERRRNDLLQQVKKVEERTLDSSRRCVGMVIESEKVGVETAQDLAHQREQLRNTENRLDDINSTLKDTQKNINGIKSVFSSLKQWWSTPNKQKSEATGGDKEDNKGGGDRDNKGVGDKDSRDLVFSKHLASAVEDSDLSLQFSQNQQSHPALRLRGLDEQEDNYTSSEFKKHSQMVNDQLDQDLSMMSSGLSRLKNLARGLGDEIQDHNAMIDRIHDKADKTDVVLNSQNTQMKRILKR